MTRPGRMKRWWRPTLGPGAILVGVVGVAAWAARDPWPARARFDPPGGQTALARRFAADGSTLLTVGYDGVRAWDLASGRLRAGPTGPAWTDQARSPDGRHFAARAPGTGLAAHVAWGDAASGAILGRAEAPTFPLGPVAWVDGGRTIRVVAMGLDGACAAWSWDRASGRESVRTVLGPPGRGATGHPVAACSDDGRVLAFRDEGAGSVQLWDAAADAPLGVIPRPADQVETAKPDVTLDPLGRAVAVAWPDGLVEAWTVAPPRRVGAIRFWPERYRLGTLRVAPDGRAVAAEVVTIGQTHAEQLRARVRGWLGVRDDRPAWGVVVVDLVAGRARAHAPGSTAPEFSPDGRWVVTREPDGALASRASP